jgi:F-type H+-transporting ATPase subunit delta
MGLRIVAKRYAEAFVDYAKGSVGLERAVDEVKALKAIMRDNTEFYQILSSPSLTLAEKFEFVDAVFAGRFSRELSQFVKLVVEKQRAALLFDMLDYIRVNYSHGEETDAVLRSAYPLDLDVVQRIEKALEKKYNKKLHFYLDLDAELLGGVQVIIGNTVIDGSLKRRLEDLAEKVKMARMR